jgi:hypothetical protein
VETSDQRADRLAAIACDLVQRVRDEDPADTNRWLTYTLPDSNDRWALLFVLAAAVPTDKPWRHLTAWTLPARPQVGPQPVDDADRSAA